MLLFRITIVYFTVTKVLTEEYIETDTNPE